MRRPDENQPHETATLTLPGASEGDGLSLRVFGKGIFALYPLPREGHVVLGRSMDADVKIDDRSISRRHAVLSVGSSLTVADLGSNNGTRVGGQRLEPHRPRTVLPGDLIELGAILAVVQRLSAIGLPTPIEARASAAEPLEGKTTRTRGAMQSIDRLVDRIAAGPISVIVLGETGVGKGVMAETIHERSPRAGRPFLGLNCAALSDTLLESELFGHEKGAFTGAAQAKAGLLETAHGGTVFLDEIGDLPARLQVTLLRVLEDRHVLRVGSLTPRTIDVRFIAATHRDLEQEIAAGRFRADLYFRLNGISFVIPPLRERVEEIATLARRFVALAAQALVRPAPTLSPEALTLLEQHSWPGNIRELRNAMDRAVLIAPHDVIAPEHLRLGSGAIGHARPVATASEGSVAPATSRSRMPQRDEILDALAQCGGNQTQAAKRLGISRGTLLVRLDAFGVPRPRRKSRGA
jgi:two-component system response regulator AtoC